MTSLQVVIKEIKNLKPIPAVVTSLLEIVDDPNASMKDITKNTLPTLTYLKKLLFPFYCYSRWRGTLQDHPNRLTAVEVSRMVNAGLIKYQIITALKK